MNGKPIKQIAAELHISKQALWQRIKRHQQILYSNIETLSKLVAVSDFITA